MPLLFTKRKFADQILNGRKGIEYRKKPLKPGYYTLFAGKKLGDVEITKVTKVESISLSPEIWTDLELCYGPLPKFIYAHELRVR